MRLSTAVLLALLGSTASLAQEAAPAGAPLRFESSEVREWAGTWGEPFRAVMLLPGVGHVLSGAGLPVVRGAQPSSTAFLLDGVRVPMLYHLGLGPAVVHPDFIAGLDFHRGTAPARLGREAAGVVDLRAVAPADRARAVASLDLLNVGLFTQVPFTRTGTEATLAGRFAYTPWLFATLTSEGPQAERVANLYDYQARVSQRVGAGALRLLALGSSDTVGTRGEGTVAEVGAGFHRVDLRLTQPVGSAEAEAALTWGVDTLDFSGGGDVSRLALRLTEQTLGARVGYRVPLSSHWRLEAGADVERRRSAVDQSSTLRMGDVSDADRPTVRTAVRQPVARATYSGAWVQATWADGPWQLSPGLRVDGYHGGPGLTEVVLEPRLHARRALSEAVALRLGAGLAHQTPGYLVDVPGAESAALRLGLQRVLHLNAGADVRAPWGFEVSADAFVDPLLRTVELDLFALDFLDPNEDALREARTGRGLAYGVEVLARRRLSERWALLASYSFQQRTLRTQVERRDEAGRVRFSEEATVTSALEQAHIFNAALTLKLGWGLTAGATLHFNTGAPEAGGLASYTQREGVDPLLGRPRWVAQDRDRVERLPGFFRMDARLSKQGTLGPLAVEAWLDVLNVTLARETFRYSYGRQGGGLTRKPFGVPPLTLPSLGVRASL